ncbi:MAG: SLBB domain-containing protein, partial [Fibrobacterota bacterium]|nr:SLBB domain-containing protein [Fibrobacterota bacterium]
MEAVRSGKLKLTDEMIEAQRKLHPELNGLSNQEARNRLESKAAASKGDTETSVISAPEKPKPPEPPASNSRFPEGLVRFGYDFFKNNNAGVVDGSLPALPEYILSPGDEIQIYTWGRENQNRNVIIDNEGMFRYPPLEPMRMAGLKFDNASKNIIAALEKIHGIKASVALGKLRSIRIMVLGEVSSPGSYVVPAGATVTSALFKSGGITNIGSLRGIQVRKGGQSNITLDLYDMLLRGNSRGDVQLLSGDAVFVPVAPIQIAVTGMVKRPAIYEVRSGTKVLYALELAGGLSSSAFKGRVRLDRVESHKRKVVLDVGMEKVGGNSNVSLQDGDILNIEEVLSREYDVVYLQGNVNRPGRYEYKKGMTIRDLVPGVKDLKTETFFTYGHIKRSSEDDQGALLLPFSLKDVFENNTSVPLMPRDTVIVYSKYDIMDQPEVKISGVVRRPGKYPFVDKMRISDLVIAGGGLTMEAYLHEAHLIRSLNIKESDSLYSTLLKVNLANLIDNPGDENNVELRPSDSLIIFPRENFVLPKAITINGAIKKSGSFELTQNMGVPELISQAEGLTKNTYKVRIEVVRRIIERDSVVKREIHSLNLKDLLEGRRKFGLQDGDAVYIRDVVDHQGAIGVTLAGEFNFPGRYEASKGERISSLIRRAGGFTPAAYLNGAV